VHTILWADGLAVARVGDKKNLSVLCSIFRGRRYRLITGKDGNGFPNHHRRGISFRPIRAISTVEGRNSEIAQKPAHGRLSNTVQ